MKVSNRFRAAAIAAAVVFLALGWTLQRGAGLTRSPTGAHGAWNVPRSALYDLALDSGASSLWTIDSHPAVQTNTEADRNVRRTVWLDAGFHAIEVRHDVVPDEPSAGLRASLAGESLEPIPIDQLKQALPRNPRLRAVAASVRTALGWLIAVMAFLWARSWLPSLRIPVFTKGRWLAWGALAFILAWAALLRVDALTARFGVVTSPAWVAAVQTRTVLPPLSIRHHSFPWVPAPLYSHDDGPPTNYISDPYTYLKAAREKPSFYSAHYREPVFPYAVKIALRLFNGQDVSVSFASLGFSLLAVWLTYVLGAALWSRPAGLLAALALAIDRDVIAQSILGWRDDAYVAAVVLCGYLFLRCWRDGSRPARVAFTAAAVLGVAAGFTILVRIMALSFILAGGAYLILTMRTAIRRRVQMAVIAAIAAFIVTAPYFLNCWRVYGDPFYTFNVHGDVYRVAEGQAEAGQGTFSYIAEKIASRPFTAIDTILRGLTTYPFENKWIGLESWRQGLGRFARAAALAGLLIMLFSQAGRLLLVILVSSLIPFSFTWRVDPNWRFTEHALPYLFVAGAVAMSAAGRLTWLALSRSGSLRRIFSDRDGGEFQESRRSRRWVLASGLAVALTITYLAWFSPSLMFAETLRAREDGMIDAAAINESLLGDGWLPGLAGTGNVRMKVALDRGTVSFPLPEATDYTVTLRIDPFPQPLTESAAQLQLRSLEFRLNDQVVSTLPMTWTPGRVAAYQIVLPRHLVRTGSNELAVRLQPRETRASVSRPGLSDGDAVAFWHLRVHPPR